MFRFLISIVLAVEEKHEIHKLEQNTWYDCSMEEKIDAKIKFINITSEPKIWNPGEQQIIHKVIDNISNETFPSVSIDFQQLYKVLNRWWITFVSVHNIDQCSRNKGFCPWHGNERVNLTTVHAKLLPIAPYGLYRSRQIYRNSASGEKLGCVDILMEYRSPNGELVSETTEEKLLEMVPLFEAQFKDHQLEQLTEIVA